MEYKNFTLDDFQINSLEAIDRWNTVIVCAPTGSGKTLIAEYIIDKCIRENHEVIYTAPIKALSNQKYRDFKAQYGDKVGILTGDVVINSNAPCLIMTTEIFRNIIYDDPKRLSNVKYVIFDEVHYIEDPRRGTVWEESIMLAPQHIHFLCLSATIANVDELASWMQSIRQSEVSVIIHEKRPVPLEPFVYIAGGNIPFQLNNLNKALAYANTIAEKMKQVQKSGQPHEMRQKSGVPIFEYLLSKSLLPALCFSFSRKNCEKMAFQYKYMNLLKAEEAAEAVRIFDEHIERFNLKGYLSTQNLRRLIEFGTAFHHAGMLPAQKDIVEILFSKNLIKILFATETFAVGINMPAKTVVFDGLEKNDGICFRYLKSYEYQQMSGRAGRRGIDEKGFVYALIDPKYYNYAGTKQTLLGKLEPLKSQFAFSYSSILNLHETKNKAQIMELCEKSFGYYQMKSVIELKVEKMKQLDEKLSNLDCRVPQPRKLLSGFVENMKTIENGKMRLNELRRMLRKRMPEDQKDIRCEMRAVENNIGFASKNMRRTKCAHCNFKAKCVAVAEAYYTAKAELHNINNFGFDLDGKFAFLEAIGYIKDDKLQPRGLFASQIFGYEVAATELYFEGYIGKLNADELNALICGIVFENKTRASYVMKSKELKDKLKAFRYRMEDIVRRELNCCKVGSIKPIENAMAEMAYKWSTGATFQEITQSQDLLLEGDIIRLFRNCVDLLRQLKRVLVQDTISYAKIDACLKKMNRDIVDAEQYFN